ncbi:phosphonate C-P lyase system protein PhnG [Photobacterium ganghwense]|uniref:phosphonate C-P lyase system protein PhnG n=1 Tax=Photobacterium ganghwense TaxID=320778 RepID=UPI001A8DBA65|nr:phosphonate C-P lyase system protein PhnG [Photobacterium ganghwense]QSV16807.1 phosphonate C-P lyase system protein PhnG [Photobacterium ganghwense]
MTTPEPMSAPAFSRQDRQRWMKTLALASGEQLQQLWTQFPDKPDFSYLRPTESGLVQVRGRLGNTGDRFNMGDMTVTRASVVLESGLNGFAYIQGRDKTHADIAAVVDALMQSERAAATDDQILQPLVATQQAKRAAATADTLKTKVDFFTLVRGEDD